MMKPIDFGGQRSRVKVTIDIYGNKLVNTIETKNGVCFFIKLGRHVIYGERMNSIDFGGHRSKVKVMKDIIDKCQVHGDATLSVVIFDYQFFINFFNFGINVSRRLPFIALSVIFQQIHVAAATHGKQSKSMIFPNAQT